MGLVMAVASNGFVQGVKLFTSFRETDLPNAIASFGATASLAPLLALLVTAALVICIRRIFNVTRWHGPADSIYAAHRVDNELDVKAGVASTLAAFVSAGGGASVGQYGPLVHFGATLGSYLNVVTRGVLTTDIFIGCGVAGAIGAGFNAPIAGMVFAHEAVLRHFSLRAIAPIAISSISSAWISDWMLGSEPLLSFDASSIDLTSTLPWAMIVGPVFGLFAVLFMLAIRFSVKMSARSGLGPEYLLVIAATITGLVGVFVPEVLGLGTQALADMVAGEFDFTYLWVMLAFKLLLTALCIGFGLFGGVFSPALFVGAAVGAVFGRVLAALGFIAAGPVLAICGMAAVSASVIGAPIAGVLIILEMTHSYELTLLALMSVVLSIKVSHTIFGHSFFDRQLLDRGIDIAQGRGHIELMQTPVAAIVSPDFFSVGPDARIADVIKQMAKAGVSEGYVIGTDGEFVGKFTLHGLLGMKGAAAVLAVLEPDPIRLKNDASLQQAIELASGFVGEAIPVLDSSANRLLGVVTEADLFALYLSLQNKIVDLERS